jgi:predicted unusual protein kinase regulating ubiquinone biosynthesis (AarF/ABC1/UbiB family)
VGLRAYWRFVVVLWQLGPLFLTYLRDRRRFFVVGASRRVTSEDHYRRAETLLDSILTLGPTFIKLGQLLSTRPDILPQEYIEVLAELQDRVPPADWADARAVLEEDVGGTDAFETFETEPISGASLGQVYTADHDGQPVAVKIRRPGVESLVEADLRAIRWLLPVIKRFVGESRAFSLENLADEFDTTIHEEMDYGREARMLTTIRENFGDNDRVAIPRVIEDRSTERVLTMEYIEGAKISDLDALDEMGVDRTAVATTLQRAYLQMIVEDGVFHADPHPGNLAVQADGTIVFYDFGMSGTVSQYTQDRIVEFYVAVANRDIDGILDSLIALGTLSPEADREVMGEVMELAIADARGEDIDQYRVQQIVGQVEDTIYEFPLRLPANLALVLRVATVVEGVCVTLDPEFDFIATATDYLTEQGYREEGVRQFVAETGEQLRESAAATIRTPPKLEAVLDKFERDAARIEVDLRDSDGVLRTLEKRLVYGLFVSVGMLSTALLYAFDEVEAAAVGGGLTILFAVVLYWSFRERSGITARPQFTRQNLKERQDDDLADEETASVGTIERD